MAKHTMSNDPKSVARTEKRFAHLFEGLPDPAPPGKTSRRGGENAGSENYAAPPPFQAAEPAFTLEEHPSESTGIFTIPKGRSLRYRAGGKPPTRKQWAEMQEQMRHDPRDRDLRAHVDALELSAKKYYESLGGFPGLRKTKDAVEWYALPPKPPGADGEADTRRNRKKLKDRRDWLRAKRVQNFLLGLPGIRKGLERLESGGELTILAARELAFEAYRFGRLTERILLTPFEEAVRETRSFLEKREEDRNTRKGVHRDDRSKTFHEKILRAADEIEDDLKDEQVGQRYLAHLIYLKAFTLEAKDMGDGEKRKLGERIRAILRKQERPKWLYERRH